MNFETICKDRTGKTEKLIFEAKFGYGAQGFRICFENFVITLFPFHNRIIDDQYIEAKVIQLQLNTVICRQKNTNLCQISENVVIL